MQQNDPCALTNKIYASKTPEVVEALLQEHRRLVYYMLTQTYQLNNADAESAAWEALWRAIMTFDIYSESAFSTYACRIIKNAIGDVLRKQNTESKKAYAVALLTTDSMLTTAFEPENTEIIEFINKQFDEFVKTKTGAIRNVLLVWYSSGFSASAVNIAKVCNVSASYVCRVQTTFRAYLSGRLRTF